MSLARLSLSARTALQPAVASCSRGAVATRLFSTSSAVQGKSAPGRGKDAVRRARKEARLAKQNLSMQGVAKRDTDEPRTLAEAVRILQAVEITKPLAAYELHIVTTVSTHVANALRGRLLLPFSPRTKPEVLLIFAGEENEAGEEARAIAKASDTRLIVGGAELIADVVEGRVSGFTKVLCTPELMNLLSRNLARSFGPKGLMPSVKRGTVVSTKAGMRMAIEEARGAMDWRGDKLGNVRGAVARLHHPLPAVKSNISALLSAVVARASSGLGSAAASGPQGVVVASPRAPGAARSPSELRKASNVITQIHISSTQGPGIPLLLSDVY